ncbi:MAG: type IV secretion system protein, partial [Gammaproteobacteria bacterium]|nr:type IV secretion system protein [Gammaproteobacteria bacterium]
MDDLGLAIFSILFRQLIVYQDKFFSLLSNELGTFFLLVTTLYIVIVGYKVLMGSFKDRTKEAVISIILVALLHGMIIDNDSAYMKSFTGVIYATVMQTSGYVASLGESTSYQGLFLSVGRLAEASTETSEAISSRQPSSSFITFSEVKVGTALFILQILFLVVYLVFIALFTVGIFAIVILLSVSAVPIFFAAFKETRFIFFTWLKTLLNYMLFPIFVSMALGI